MDKLRNRYSLQGSVANDQVPDIRVCFPDFGTCSFGKGGNFESY